MTTFVNRTYNTPTGRPAEKQLTEGRTVASGWIRTLFAGDARSTYSAKPGPFVHVQVLPDKEGSWALDLWIDPVQADNLARDLHKILGELRARGLTT